MTRHRVPAIVLLGQVPVVSGTHQADVDETMSTPKAIRVTMVVLEALARRAASAPLVNVSAPVFITLANRSPDGRRDVA